jgi:hypothetical protein
MSFGFTDIDGHGKKRSQYLLCMNILAEDNMKPNKLKEVS